jgi:hypothetical protein
LRSFANISTLRSNITLFEIQELALIDIKANIELIAITINKINEYENAASLERLEENNVSTIWPVISGIEVSNTVAKTIIIEVKASFPM